MSTWFNYSHIPSSPTILHRQRQTPSFHTRWIVKYWRSSTRFSCNNRSADIHRCGCLKGSRCVSSCSCQRMGEEITCLLSPSCYQINVPERQLHPNKPSDDCDNPFNDEATFDTLQSTNTVNLRSPFHQNQLSIASFPSLSDKLRLHAIQ